MSNRRQLGIAAKLNGKDVKWAGNDYGWQSPNSYTKLKSQGKLPQPPKPITDKLGEGLNKYLGHLGRDVVKQVRNLKAEALLRSNEGKRSHTSPTERSVTNHFHSGGIETNDHQTISKAKDSKGKWREVWNADGTPKVQHDLEFHRQTYDGKLNDGTVFHSSGYNQTKRHIPRDQQTLRRANIKYQAGQVLENVSKGDVVKAYPIPSDSGRDVRGRIYERLTNGALKSTNDGEYDAVIDTEYLGNNKWKNAVGETVDFDPQDLKKSLTKLASGSILRRLVSHPAVQAAITADEIVGGVTGKKPSEVIGEEHRRTNANYIQQRLTGGSKFFTPGTLRF